MTRLGQFGDPCVERHSAFIVDRGGTNRVFQPIDLTTVTWERAMDRKTKASILITGRACSRQAALLNSIRARRHELVIFRGSSRVWEGPITNTESTSSFFRVDAADVIEYLDFTALSRAWPDTTGGKVMTERLREIITYELTTDYVMPTNDGNVTVTRWENVDPPANVLPYLDIRTGTTKTRSSTDPFDMTVGEHLYDLGRSIGVNYTTIGRKLLIWDGFLGRLRTVTENDFAGDFSVIGAGTDFWNISHVSAVTAEEGQPPAVGHAANAQGYYGPWEKVTSVQSEDTSSLDPSQSELNSQARRELSGRYPVPLVLASTDGGSIIPSKGITINQLVAGVQIPVVASRNIRNVSQMQRLVSLRVTENATTGETLSATLEADGEVFEA